MAVATLATDRLLLREWRESDLEAFAAVNADPKVMEFFPRTLSRDESDAFAARIDRELRERGFGLWAVEPIEGAPFIGYVGLSKPSFQCFFTPCIEIGWRIAHEHWAHGYASEAACKVLQHAFASLGLPEVVSFTAQSNARSRRVMERIGMQRLASEDFDHPGLPEGHPLRRHVLYRLKRSTWESAHPSIEQVTQ